MLDYLNTALNQSWILGLFFFMLYTSGGILVAYTVINTAKDKKVLK